MALPFPDSPKVKENIAASISRIEQNVEYLDGLLTNTAKVIISTKDLTDATGDTSYAGVGFLPRMIIAFSIEATGDSSSWGCSDDDADEYCIYWDYNDATARESNLVSLTQAAGKSQKAVLKQYDSDGFTLTWTKVGAPVGDANIIFLCLK